MVAVLSNHSLLEACKRANPADSGILEGCLYANLTVINYFIWPVAMQVLFKGLNYCSFVNGKIVFSHKYSTCMERVGTHVLPVN